MVGVGADAGAEKNLFIERERELARLHALAGVVEDGPAIRLALIIGELGVGKSRLVSEFVERLPSRWVRIHVGCDAGETSWSSPFAELLDGEDVDAEGEPARALAHALVVALHDRCAGGTLVLVAEDLQAVDPVTITALQHLLATSRRAPVLVVGTYRLGSQPFGSPHARAVSSLLRHPASDEVRVHPLSPAGVAELAAERGFDGDPEELFARTAGNPFLAEELIRVGTATAIGPGTIVAADLATLSVGAIDLSIALAVSGRPLGLSVVRRIDPDGSAAAELLRRGLVVSDATSLRFRHWPLADALLATLSDAERRAHHRALAEALALEPSSRDEDLARHWSESGDWAGALPSALRAAEQLDAHRSHASAVEMYRIALAGLDPEEPLAKRAVLERAVLSAGLAADDEQVARWAGEGREMGRIAGVRWAGATRWSNSHFQRLARGLDASAETDDPAVRVAALVVEAQELAGAGRFEAAAPLACEAAAQARALGDRFVESDALLLMGYTGDPARAAAVLGEAARAAEADGDLTAATLCLARKARLDIAVGDLAAALDANLAALAIGRRSGGPELWGSIAAISAFTHVLRGELDAAELLASELDTHELPMLTIFGQAIRWNIAIDHGDETEARRLCEVTLPLARALGDPYFLAPMLMLAGRTHLLAGDPAAAVALLDEATDAMWSPLQELVADVLHALICASGDLRDRDRLEQLRKRANELTLHIGRPGILALAEMAEGAIRDADGDARGAADSFERAARSFAAAERRPMAVDAWTRAAAAHLDNAELLGGLDPAYASARAAIEAAAELIDGFALASGVGRLSAARERLDAIPAPSSDPLAALSERERTMVLLAASGSSNREIGAELYLAEKTVRNSLTAAFAKLGVSRRTQLATLVGGLETASG